MAACASSHLSQTVCRHCFGHRIRYVQYTRRIIQANYLEMHEATFTPKGMQTRLHECAKPVTTRMKVIYANILNFSKLCLCYAFNT